VELRHELADAEDLVILYVLAEGQVNAKTRRFIAENRLGRDVRFLTDPDSRLIGSLGLAKPDPEPIEAGVPHPATYLVDRNGRIRMADVREDFQIWLAPETIRQSLADLD
jgi:peroxiredoxin